MKPINVDISTIKLAGIECMFTKPNQPKGKLPILLLYHGWASKKENMVFIATILSQYGYGVILPDAIEHGQRGKIDYHDLQVLRSNFWRIVIETVEEANLLLDNLIKIEEIDLNRIGVLGSSMGGFIASGIFAHNKKVKTLVSMNGSSAWEKSVLF